MGVILFFLALWGAPELWAKSREVDLPRPNTTVTWIDAKGQLIDLKWKRESQWVLKELAEPPYKQLVIRTWIAVPAKLELKGVRWPGGKHEVAPSGAPIAGNPVISIDAETIDGSGSIRLTKKDGSTLEYGFIHLVNNRKPFPWIDETCEEAGISLKQWKDAGDNLYFAVNCLRKDKEIEVFFQKPIGAKMKVRSTGALKTKKERYQVYRFSLSKKPKVGRKTIGAVHLKEKTKKGVDTSFYNIYWGEKVAKRKLELSVSLGPSFLSYSESPVKPVEVDDQSYVVTVKANAVYRLSEKWDLGGNAFSNLFTVGHSQKAISSARFFGANLRLGYLLLKRPKLVMKGLLGWYLWGMTGTGGNYGLNYLTGPQIFFAFAFPRSLPRPFWVYLKYSPLEQSLLPSFTNREFAGGLGYQISSARLSRKWAVTLDISHLSTQIDGFPNRIELLSVSLGLQVGLTKQPSAGAF